MKKTLLLLSVCLVIVLIFHLPQICAGEENTSASGKNEPAENSKKWSKEIFLDSYKIGRGDVLEIITWKEPNFSRDEILVRMDGMITFPLLGDIQVEGRTPLKVKKDIEIGLKDFIEDPVVTVTVKTPESQKFYILGEVVNTGEYHLITDLTLLQAFALAGGFTRWASRKEIILIRNEDGKEKIYRINYKDIMNGKDFSQNIHIKAKDTIIVP
jgi:polysaccharide export outer membrane protein